MNPKKKVHVLFKIALIGIISFIILAVSWYLLESKNTIQTNENKVKENTSIESDKETKKEYSTQLTRKDKKPHYNISTDWVYFDSFMPNWAFWSWTQTEVPNANEKTFKLINDYIGINKVGESSIVYRGGKEENIEYPENFEKAIEGNESYYSDWVYVYTTLQSNKSKLSKITEIFNWEEIMPFIIEKYDYPNRFLRIGNRLFYQWIQITNADPDSFKFIFHDDSMDSNLAENDSPWFADKDRVYMFWNEVIGADPESIRIPEQERNLSARVAIDDNYVYSFYAYKKYSNKCRENYCLIDLRLNNMKSEGFHVDEDDYIRGYKSDRYITKEGTFDGTGNKIQ